MQHRARVIAGLLVATLGLGLVTAGAASAEEKKTETSSLIEAQANAVENTREFVGKVDGTDAYIAILELDGNVEIYICDGAGLITWPTGTVKGGKLEAKSASGVTVSGTLDDSGATGTVTLADGTQHAFTAEPAVSPAGLYRRLPAEDAEGKSVRAATILLLDGTSRGGSSSASLETCKSIAKEALNVLATLTVESDGNGGTATTGPIGAADKAERLVGLFFNSGCLKTVGGAVLSPAR